MSTGVWGVTSRVGLRVTSRAVNVVDMAAVSSPRGLSVHTGPSGDDAIICVLQDRIDEDPCRVFDGAVLAAAAGLSVNELRDVLDRAEGVTPGQFVLHHRLRHVHDALAGGESDIARVARAWGFVHRGRFSDAYAVQYGQLPDDTAAGASASAG